MIILPDQTQVTGDIDANSLYNLMNICITNSNYYLFQDSDPEYNNSIYTDGSIYFNSKDISIATQSLTNISQGPISVLTPDIEISSITFSQILMIFNINGFNPIKLNTFPIYNTTDQSTQVITINNIDCLFSVVDYQIDTGIVVEFENHYAEFDTDKVTNLVANFKSEYDSKDANTINNIITNLINKYKK